MNLPKNVTIVEVGPRDGLQNEAEFVPTDQKIDLIERLSEAGLKRIEITSFVHPKAIPQLQDSEEVVQRVRFRPDIVYSTLVPNERGLERALAAGVKRDQPLRFRLRGPQSEKRPDVCRGLPEGIRRHCSEGSQPRDPDEGLCGNGLRVSLRGPDRAGESRVYHHRIQGAGGP